MNLLDGTSNQGQHSSPSLGVNAAKGLNIDEILDRLGGDWDLLVDVCDIFVLEAPGMRSALENAITSRDAHSLERAAHSLKGAVSALSDHDCADAALSLEQMGREQKIDAAADFLPTMVKQLDMLVASVVSLRSSRLPQQHDADAPGAKPLH